MLKIKLKFKKLENEILAHLVLGFSIKLDAMLNTIIWRLI